MNNPKVSIIVPVYNVERYLNRCINSILNQTFCDFECILVNDCSTDNSLKLCYEFAKLDNRIKVINNEQNQGSSQSRKTGFEHSTGDHIQFIDADDWIENNMLEIMYEKAVSEDYDIVVCNFFKYYEDNSRSIINQYINNYNNQELIKGVIKKNYEINKISQVIWNKLVKRYLYSYIKFPKQSNSEDNYITIQLLYYVKKITCINIPLYNHFHNDQSLSVKKNNIVKKFTERSEIWIQIIDFLRMKYSNLYIFEPFLSDRINYLKYICFKNKHLRFNKNIYKLYPESGFKCYLIKKITDKFNINNNKKKEGGK